MSLRPWQSRTLRLLGTAALVTGIFWFIPFSEVLEALRGVELVYVYAGFALYFTGILIECLQLWLLLARVGIPITLWRVFETKLITRFYGQFLPSELLASAVKLHRLAGPTRQWGEVAAALAFSRVANMLVLVGLGLAFWAIEMPTGPGRWIGVILFGMAVALVALHFVLVSPVLGRLAHRMLLGSPLVGRFRGRFVDAGVKLMRTTVSSYRLFGDAIWPVGGLAVLRHVLGIVSFSLLALALGLHISYLTIGWIRVVMQAIMMLPITLSGIGIREGSLIILLQEYAVPPGKAVALAFLLFLIQLTGNSLGGVLELRTFWRAGRRPDPAQSVPE